MKIHNVFTNIVGRTQFVVELTGEEWRNTYRELIEKLLKQMTGGEPFEYLAQIGHFVIHYRGNDAHVDEFYRRNWPPAPAGARPHGSTVNLTGVTDVGTLRLLKGIHSDADAEAALARLHKDLNAGGGKYRKQIRDERIANIEDYPPEKQIEIMLSSPSAIYVPDEVLYITVNTNYYGEVKTKSSLGPLDDMITKQIRLDAAGNIANPGEIWLSLHAGCVIYTRDSGEERGAIIIAPTGTGKSTNCYGMVDAKPTCKLVADDFAYVNLETLETVYSERHFYMRTNIAENYPHLIPYLIHEPLENVEFCRESLQLIAAFETPEDMHDAVKRGLATDEEIKDLMRQTSMTREDIERIILAQGRITYRDYDRLVDEMCANPAARSLIDPCIMVGEEKFCTTTSLNEVILGKRDYDDRFIVRQLDTTEMMDILTSQGNVFNYLERENDADGYPICFSRTTEIYYDPYLISVHVVRDPATGKEEISDLDRLRIAAWRHLGDHPSIRMIWFNTRLPAAQSQFCLRKYMEGEVDEVHIIKGVEITDELCATLGLTKRPKEPVHGRRAMDLVGLYDTAADGSVREVEVLGFYKGTSEGRELLEAVAFSKAGRGLAQVRSWSQGTVDEFLAANKHLGVRTLLSE